jgi:hypothetical protein
VLFKRDVNVGFRAFNGVSSGTRRLSEFSGISTVVLQRGDEAHSGAQFQF